MTDLLDFLTSFWMNRLVMIGSFLLGVIGIFFLGYSNGNKKREKYKIIGVTLIGLFAFAWVIGFSLAWSLKMSARQDVINLLNQPELVIKINNKELIPEYANRVINELKKLESIPTEHSSPTKEIELEIISKNKSLTLRIKQDSRNKFEFWVFLDEYRNTKENDIGKLSTLVFLKYYGS